jgi:cellulose synthase/poly-beta-1,6-N-acetylglucosamine synthase-like glycosyltransferase
MSSLEIVFWCSVAVLAFAYVAYPALVAVAAHLMPERRPESSAAPPAVTIVIPAYRESAVLERKLASCLDLDHPPDALEILVVTDASDPQTEAILECHSARVAHLRLPERRGKAAALNAAMREVSTPVAVLTDANALFAPDALRLLLHHLDDPRTGAVSGEKRVRDTGSGGEGLYWRYESYLKRCDARVRSVVGAAGELLALRTSLWRELEEDTVLDDFVASMRIALAGHRVAYEPAAVAIEEGPATAAEDWERRVRIAAGGWQAMLRLPRAFVPWPDPVLWMLFVAHRALRWSLAPLAVGAGVVALTLLVTTSPIYAALAAGCGLLLLLAVVASWAPHSTPGRIGRFPRQFLLMHAAVPVGMLRLIRGRQPGAWRKAPRA